MHSVLARRAKNVADEALLRASAAAGAIIPPLLPDQSLTINVSKGGNDATGDGTDEKPYLTIGKALLVAPTYSPTFENPALILVGPGSYVENLLIPPFVWVAAFEAGNTVTVGTGAGSAISLAPSWFAPSAFNIGGVESVIVAGDIVIDFTGATAFGFIVFGQPVVLEGSFTVIGDPTNGGNVYFPPGSSMGFPVSCIGADLTSQGCEYFAGATIAITSTATQPAIFSSDGDTVHASITLDSTAGMSASAELISTGVVGPLNLAGAGTSYQATAGGVPPVVNLSAGAPPPVLLTEGNGIGFTATVPGNWVGAAPLNLHDAVNRIANNTTNVHPIP
jgi:hypothetical protein